MVKRTFVFKNESSGAFEIYDESTGELLGISKKNDNPVLTKEERRVKVELLDGKVAYIDPKNDGKWEYSIELGQKLCDELVSGAYIMDLCDGVKFPEFKIIARWKRTYPEFNRIMLEAYEDRAEYFGDMIRKFADETHEKNAGAQTVKINAYKHLAAVDNPKRYQPKANEKGSTGGLSSTTIVVVTGIVRPGDQAFEVAQQKEILPEGKDANQDN